MPAQGHEWACKGLSEILCSRRFAGRYVDPSGAINHTVRWGRDMFADLAIGSGSCSWSRIAGLSNRGTMGNRGLFPERERGRTWPRDDARTITRC
jgi:hypothetical protein